MALADELGDVVLECGEVGVVLSLDVDLLDVIDAEELLHGGGVGDEDLIVGIEESLIALGFEDAGDAEVDAVDLDGLSDGVAGAEEVFDGDRAQDRDAGVALDVLLGEAFAVLDLKGADGEIGDGGALDAGAGVFAEEFDLGAAADDGGDLLDAFDLKDGGRVVEGEVLLGAGHDAAGAALTGADDEEIDFS